MREILSMAAKRPRERDLQLQLEPSGTAARRPGDGSYINESGEMPRSLHLLLLRTAAEMRKLLSRSEVIPYEELCKELGQYRVSAEAPLVPTEASTVPAEASSVPQRCHRCLWTRHRCSQSCHGCINRRHRCLQMRHWHL